MKNYFEEHMSIIEKAQVPLSGSESDAEKGKKWDAKRFDEVIREMEELKKKVLDNPDEEMESQLESLEMMTNALNVSYQRQALTENARYDELLENVRKATEELMTFKKEELGFKEKE